jgi:hypothetical protein
MKKYLLSSLIVVSSVMAFASADQVLETNRAKEKALSLILKSSSQMKVRGDVSQCESLSKILDPVQEALMGGLIDGISMGQRHKTETNIKKVTVQCKQVVAEYANCTLTIDYKLLGSTAIKYSITLDHYDEPADLASSYADVIRGD